MLLIFLIIPIFWSWLLDLKLNFKEKLFFGMVIFWIGLVPFIWFLNKYLGLSVNNELFWFLFFLVSFILWIYKLIRNKCKLVINIPKINFDWSLITILLFFGLLHILFYHFYVTMPEWDGYTNILRIEKMVESGNINYQYRPFFYTAMTVLTQVTGIGLYRLHVFWMVALSSIYLVVMSWLIDKNKIKFFWSKILLLLFGLAVPVINMEIDFFRPQNLYLLLFPIIFYLERKENNYLAFLVSLLSLGYHQFFIFPVMILGLKIFFKMKKQVRCFLFVFVSILGIIFFSKIISYLPVNRITENIGQFDKWRWWFLNSYQTFPDNVEMGWPGLTGAVKYYGYYFGPLIMVCLGLILFNLKKLKSQKYWLLIIGFLLIISEVLPRLNVVYLPERFPLLIDITVLLLLPYLFIKTKFNKWLMIVLILIGVGGSIYIAYSKGSLTNRQELKAVWWIKNNTSDDAVFLTQESNRPMIDFFAKRKFVYAGKLLWNSNPTDNEYYEDIGEYETTVYKIKSCENCYILYSTQKFGGLRDERSYWSEYNYEGVNLNKFNLNYKRVYSSDGVYIWKI
jgi:hypothetical protein